MMETKNALIVGIRDEASICHGIATEIKRAGYQLYATYHDESTYDSVSRVAESLGIIKLFRYDARKDEDLKNLAQNLKEEDVRFDLLVHGISYSTAKGAKLDMELTEVSWEEFTDAIRVGAFSLVELTGALLGVMKEESSVLSISMRWSKVAVPNFNIVCATKAGLESIIRGLADSLGGTKGIRVNGISPGFLPTYSLGKIGNSLEMLEREKKRSPLTANVRLEDVASLALSVMENRSITGMIYPIDCGVEIMS